MSFMANPSSSQVFGDYFWTLYLRTLFLVYRPNAQHNDHPN